MIVPAMSGAARRIVLETLGWLLLLVGIAALVLPGPGLLGIFAGLALLSQQYEWAEKRVEPVRLRAMRAAAEGVETWPRVLMSSLLALGLVGCGIVWILSPPSPSWWLLSERLWLPGGLWTGVTQIGSGVIALVMIVYAFRRFHGRPDAVAELEHDIEDNDEEREHEQEERQHLGDRDA